MAALPPLRRIVTGHDDQGKAIFESDTLLHPIPPEIGLRPKPVGAAEPTSEEAQVTKPEGPGGFTLLFRTEGFPATTQGPWTDYHGKPIPLADQEATTLRVVDVPPGISSPLHRTQSVDFGTVLSGEVVLELDDGKETVMKPGDTCVQRGTIHAWHNRTDQVVRILFVLVPSRPVVVNGETLGPTRFEIN